MKQTAKADRSFFISVEIKALPPLTSEVKSFVRGRLEWDEEDKKEVLHRKLCLLNLGQLAPE